MTSGSTQKQPVPDNIRVEQPLLTDEATSIRRGHICVLHQWFAYQ